jgi:lipoprotein-anchoring transpeptidase ErfK/SrfK
MGLVWGAGCIRMRKVVDLYDRTPIGSKVVVLATRSVGA